MKYLIKYVCEVEYELDVGSTEEARKWAIVNQPARSRLLGVVRADIGWPDTAPPQKPTPRGRPPSGTPGTPTVPQQDQIEEFEFAEKAA